MVRVELVREVARAGVRVYILPAVQVLQVHLVAHNLLGAVAVQAGVLVPVEMAVQV